MSFIDSFTRTFARASQSLRLFPIVVISFILVAIGGSLSSFMSIYLVMFGGAIVVSAASVEMFAYLQESRRRFMKDRAYIERKSRYYETNSIEEKLDKLEMRLIA